MPGSQNAGRRYPGPMTPYEGASLAAQWVGSVSALAAVVVAVIFGYLTLASNRRSKDAQQRAAIIAATESRSEPPSVQAGRTGPRLTVRLKGGETWLLVNEGSEPAHDVHIEGLTDLDRRRLVAIATDPEPIEAGQSREFTLVSRLTLSGPANVRVSYSTETAEARTVVLLVPAP